MLMQKVQDNSGLCVLDDQVNSVFMLSEEAPCAVCVVMIHVKVLTVR